MGLTAQNNKELAKRIRKGEVSAFDQLYKQYSQRLYGFAFSMLKNNEDAKEVVQETFFKIWNKRHDIDVSTSLKAFIFSIAYHIVIDIFRKRTKDDTFKENLKRYINDYSLRGDEIVEFNELTTRLNELVAELPEKRRQVYLLSREEGLSHKEIAARLGVSVKTVENQINLSLKYIRSKLDTGNLLHLLFLFLFV